jgi:glycosyltransferase involved in cell wall biosynthesis
MLTYNQQEYIAQAIESVLMQETNFNYQLVIGEDCSTDQTKEICKKYAAKNPDKIKLLLNERNLGLGANYVKTYKECTGKYVAICDGDDYWTDPLKLQKQVDFLEKNKDFSLVYTLNNNSYPNGELTNFRNKFIPNNFEDLVKGNYIASVTALFRNEKLSPDLAYKIPSFPYGDWPTYLLILRNGGKIKLLTKVTAVYRKDFGTSTKLRKERTLLGEINLRILKVLYTDPYFKDKKKSLLQAQLFLKRGLMASYNKEHKFRKSLFLFLELILKQKPVNVTKIYLYSLKRTFL